MRCGESEFRFIERSGLYFGLLLGVIQAAIVLTMAPLTMAAVLTMALLTLALLTMTRSPPGGHLVLPQRSAQGLRSAARGVGRRGRRDRA